MLILIAYISVLKYEIKILYNIKKYQILGYQHKLYSIGFNFNISKDNESENVRRHHPKFLHK